MSSAAVNVPKLARLLSLSLSWPSLPTVPLVLLAVRVLIVVLNAVIVAFKWVVRNGSALLRMRSAD